VRIYFLQAQAQAQAQARAQAQAQAQAQHDCRNSHNTGSKNRVEIVMFTGKHQRNPALLATLFLTHNRERVECVGWFQPMKAPDPRVHILSFNNTK